MSISKAPGVPDLGQRLADAEATIQALLSGQVDAVLDPRSQTPVLLSKAQEALQSSEERYRVIVETADEGIATIDADAIFTFVNRRLAEMLGYRVEELIGRSLFSIVPEAGRAAAELRNARSRQDVSSAHETTYRRKDGSKLWALLKTSPIRDAEGAWVGTLGMITDWTRKRADEEALRMNTARLVESEGRFRQLADNIREVFFLFDPHLAEVFYVSPAYEEIFGRTCEDLYANPRSWGDGMHPDDHRRVFDEIMPAGALVPFDVEYRTIRPDGSERNIRARGFPIHDAAGAIVRLAGLAEDVTERKSLEAQFLQSQKMEGIGRLAGGVAHDFNNLLTAILGFGEMTLADLPPDSQMRQDVQQIVNAGHSAASLTRQLLAFSRQQLLDPVVLDLNTQVDGMQTLLRRVIGEDLRLAVTLGDRVRCIKADPGQIEQVIMNLAVNARDAMPAGGTLRIATENVDLDAAFVAAHPGASRGPHVRLTFTDTGVGMGRDVLAHLFEPFFTTKPLGKGTGLGLATVYGIVKQSGGYIGVKSAPGQGSAFMIDFPGVTAAAHAVEATAPPIQRAAATETVLLVEDQQELRDVVRMTLQRHGYHVLEAADGIAALSLLDGHAGRVHLLLTDVVMPVMSGPELASKVAAKDRSIRVLYTSGYTDDAIVRHGIVDAGLDLIHKPFTPRQLLSRVRDVLDRPGQRGGATPDSTPPKTGTMG